MSPIELSWTAKKQRTFMTELIVGLQWVGWPWMCKLIFLPKIFKFLAKRWKRKMMKTPGGLVGLNQVLPKSLSPLCRAASSKLPSFRFPALPAENPQNSMRIRIWLASCYNLHLNSKNSIFGIPQKINCFRAKCHLVSEYWSQWNWCFRASFLLYEQFSLWQVW